MWAGKVTNISPVLLKQETANYLYFFLDDNFETVHHSATDLQGASQ